MVAAAPQNIDEEEYAAFLWLLLETIVDLHTMPPGFKADAAIACVLDADMADVLSAYHSARAEGRLGSGYGTAALRLQDMRARCIE